MSLVRPNTLVRQFTVQRETVQKKIDKITADTEAKLTPLRAQVEFYDQTIKNAEALEPTLPGIVKAEGEEVKSEENAEPQTELEPGLSLPEPKKADPEKADDGEGYHSNESDPDPVDGEDGKPEKAPSRTSHGKKKR